jgi:hypothetical protein
MYILYLLSQRSGILILGTGIGKRVKNLVLILGVVSLTGERSGVNSVVLNLLVSNCSQFMSHLGLKILLFFETKNEKKGQSPNREEETKAAKESE